MKTANRIGGVIVFALVSCLTAVAGADNVLEPVRPGNPDKGAPFWNQSAIRFIYAPSFEFKKLGSTDRYVYTVLDSDNRVHAFTNASPWAVLSPVWADLPVGRCLVLCEGLTKDGVATGLAGTRVFWKSAAFALRRNDALRSYAEAAKMAYCYILDCPSSQFFLKNGKPDPNYDINGYPTKMHASVIEAMLNLSKLDPARKAEAMKLATLSAEFLLKTAEPADAPLANWPQTYLTADGQKCMRDNLQHTIMTLYPAHAAIAFVKLAQATGEKKWLAAAEKIADTYFKIRDPKDGSWPLVIVKKTGKPLYPNKVVPVEFFTFFNVLFEATGRDLYRKTAEECLAAVEAGPCRDWAWEGQFEDQVPGPKYKNLTKHNACDTLLYICKCHPNDAKRMALARDIIRFSEDQFVFWDEPCRAGGKAMYFPNGKGHGGIRPGDLKPPYVCEQYDCYTPVDASAAKLIRAYLAMYRVTKDALYLEKARALGDQMTHIQCDDGFIATWWNKSHDFGWMNCNAASADALMELAAAIK